MEKGSARVGAINKSGHVLWDYQEWPWHCRGYGNACPPDIDFHGVASSFKAPQPSSVQFGTDRTGIEFAP